MNLVPNVTDLELIERAIRNAKNPDHVPRPRWGVVRDLFGVGSTSAREMCVHFRINPEFELPPMKREEQK